MRLGCESLADPSSVGDVTLGRLTFKDSSGQEMSVPFGPQAPVVSIGRSNKCTIHANQKSVSRHHATFHYSNGQYEVEDLDSSNGTFLVVHNQRQRIEGSVLLSHDDVVWCGEFVLHFEERVEEESWGQSAQALYGAGIDADPTYGDAMPIGHGGPPYGVEGTGYPSGEYGAAEYDSGPDQRAMSGGYNSPSMPHHGSSQGPPYDLNGGYPAAAEEEIYGDYPPHPPGANGAPPYWRAAPSPRSSLSAGQPRYVGARRASATATWQRRVLAPAAPRRLPELGRLPPLRRQER